MYMGVGSGGEMGEAIPNRQIKSSSDSLEAQLEFSKRSTLVVVLGEMKNLGFSWTNFHGLKDGWS